MAAVSLLLNSPNVERGDVFTPSFLIFLIQLFGTDGTQLSFFYQTKTGIITMLPHRQTHLI